MAWMEARIIISSQPNIIPAVRFKKPHEKCSTSNVLVDVYSYLSKHFRLSMN